MSNDTKTRYRASKLFSAISLSTKCTVLSFKLNIHAHTQRPFKVTIPLLPQRLLQDTQTPPRLLLLQHQCPYCGSFSWSRFSIDGNGHPHCCMLCIL